LAPGKGWQLTIAHLNHALRGRSSDADERLVRRTAETMALPARVERADVRRFARAHGLSLEMAARKLRHEFLARAASQLGIPTIALAHQADDQLELFFLRLFRGSSGEGLAGMRWRSPSPADRRIELVRPLLDQPKSALLEQAASAGIRFREDASNACVDFQRNLIRRELLPLLRAKYQPALSRIILRTADIVGAEAQFAAQVASAWLSRRPVRIESGQGNAARKAAGRQSLLDHSTPFKDLPIAVQRRIIQLQLLGQGVVADYPLIEELRSTADKPVTVGPLQRATPGDWRPAADAALQPGCSGNVRRGDESGAGKQPSAIAAVRDSGGTVHLQALKAQLFNSDSIRLTLQDGAGEAQFAGARIRWQITQFKGIYHPVRRKGCESFDADKVGSIILLRHWQPGDRFEPIGMLHPVKLQDFFTNLKVPPSRRRELMVAATADGEVFWVEGLRISERFKLTKVTIRRLQWRWRRP
jgi:tRNA(Ile)-lysidine synthase